MSVAPDPPSDARSGGGGLVPDALALGPMAAVNVFVQPARVGADGVLMSTGPPPSGQLLSDAVPVGPQLSCAGRLLDLSIPRVMGVLNVTPDSFSDGGELMTRGRPDLARVRAAAEQMIRDGAAILDVGGESTRPGAPPVGAAEELARVVPVVAALADLPVVISVDTSTPAVMSAAIGAGAGFINDVRALQRPGARAVLARSHACVCLMHMRGEPTTMQLRPHYVDLLAEISGFLAARIAECTRDGIGADRIVIDPGFGFGKSVDHNLQLLRDLARITAMGPPVLVGLSRKSTIGRVTGQSDARLRVAGSIAAAVMAVERGARIVRAHDVRATVDAIAVAWAVIRAPG